MAESKLVQLNSNVFSMLLLSLGCILISDLVVTNLFMHSLSGIIKTHISEL